MLVATNNGERILASLEIPRDLSYACPECNTSVVFKAGSIKIAHFAHKPNSACFYQTGETETHRRTKFDIYKTINAAAGCSAELEVRVGSDETLMISDVLLNIRGQRVAVEVQWSHLSIQEIVRRTRSYAALKTPVIWLSPLSSKKENEISNGLKLRTSAQERFFHSLNFGRMYYWDMDAHSVAGVHFDSSSRWVEAKSWYGPGGVEEHSEGHEILHKAYRIPNLLGQPLDLTKHFTSRHRSAWKDIPEALVYIDSIKPWWET